MIRRAAAYIAGILLTFGPVKAQPHFKTDKKLLTTINADYKDGANR